MNRTMRATATIASGRNIAELKFSFMFDTVTGSLEFRQLAPNRRTLLYLGHRRVEQIRDLIDRPTWADDLVLDLRGRLADPGSALSINESDCGHHGFLEELSTYRLWCESKPHRCT